MSAQSSSFEVNHEILQRAGNRVALIPFSVVNDRQIKTLSYSARHIPDCVSRDYPATTLQEYASRRQAKARIARLANTPDLEPYVVAAHNREGAYIGIGVATISLACPKLWNPDEGDLSDGEKADYERAQEVLDNNFPEGAPGVVGTFWYGQNSDVSEQIPDRRITVRVSRLLVPRMREVARAVGEGRACTFVAPEWQRDVSSGMREVWHRTQTPPVRWESPVANSTQKYQMLVY